MINKIENEEMQGLEQVEQPEKPEQEQEDMEMTNMVTLPSVLSESIDPRGTIEMDYELVDNNGKKYLKITGIDGAPLDEAASTPDTRLKERLSLQKEPPMM